MKCLEVRTMRNVKNLILYVLILALVSTAAMADIHYVNPGESIQAAINAADPGDEIEVAPGTRSHRELTLRPSIF
jgi:hypothetical protein